MTTSHPALLRAEAFARSHHLRVPIMLGPMAGACPPSLSIAVANAGGLGSCGALLMQPAANSNGAFALNLWIPDPKPHRDAETENAVCARARIRAPRRRSGQPVVGRRARAARLSLDLSPYLTANGA
jgi:nitronate monooxygenase